MSFTYGSVPPLIPGDINASDAIFNGNSEIFGSLTIKQGTIYPTTITTPGLLTVPIINVTTLVTSGPSSLGALSVTTLVVTGPSTQASVSVGTLSVSGPSTLGSVSVGTLSVSGPSTLGSVSVGTLSVSGSLLSAVSSTVGLYGVTPVIQPTTAVISATTTVAGAGTGILDDTAFSGYTVAQVVQSLINVGILKPSA